MHLRFASLADECVRLILLLAVSASLVVYVVLSRTGALDAGNGPATLGLDASEGCPVEGAPAVDTISRARLPGLREGLRRVIFFDKGLRPYEEGVVASSSAWSDDEPGPHKSLPLSPRDPGGYEMRWWMANGDDVVVDVMVFAGTRQARDFFRRGASSRCRPVSIALSAPFPPGARNVEWRNPDGFAQEDVYLLRDRLVYRVAMVKAGARRTIKPAARTAAFSVVNGLACALPGAACRPHGGPTPAAATGPELLDARAGADSS